MLTKLFTTAKQFFVGLGRFWEKMSINVV